MSRGLNQNDRVRRLLTERGAAGIRQEDFDAPTVDGGKPIRRLASRINDARGAGLHIRTVREPNGTARYVLVAQAPRTAAPIPADEPPEVEVLVRVQPLASSSPYDPWEDAA